MDWIFLIMVNKVCLMVNSGEYSDICKMFTKVWVFGLEMRFYMKEEFKCPVCGEDWSYGYDSITSFRVFLNKVALYTTKYLKCIRCSGRFEIRKVLCNDL
jgi:hypothetical protein